MANYKLNEDAEDDLKRIYRYGVLEHGLAQADKYFDMLFEQFEELAENPLHYAVAEDLRPNYRRCVCGANSIYYRIENNYIEIVRILGRQDIDKWL